MAHVCKTCGKETIESGHLCVPVNKKDSKCDWCGSLLMDERHMCSDKLKELSYICNSCGRLAVSDKHLCKPRKVS
jgi:DNA-directed RNA polymerase subunit RPC12/RpoP